MQVYEAPKIADEHSLEAEARACNKIPGLGSVDFCDQVWVDKNGKSGPDCFMSVDARSS